VGQKAGPKAIAKLTPKSQQILSKLVARTPATQATTVAATATTPSLSNLIAGSGQQQRQPRGPRDPLPAIIIQDLVRRLNKQNK